MERLSYERIIGEVRNHAEAAFVAKLHFRWHWFIVLYLNGLNKS